MGTETARAIQAAVASSTPSAASAVTITAVSRDALVRAISQGLETRLTQTARCPGRSRMIGLSAGGRTGARSGSPLPR
nr:hypothetical protein GCM10020093_112010 [Planobispora longispora]